MSYSPPMKDIRFLLEHVIGNLPEHPDFGQLDGDAVDTILGPIADWVSEKLAPLNMPGDRKGAHRNDDGSVTTPDGNAEAYKEFCENLYNATAFSQEYGGMGLPETFSAAVDEMTNAANMSWALCLLLTKGAIHALEAHGTEEQKEKYLPLLVQGVMAATMNLTESQSGSDLSLLRSKAVKQEDGTYRITGSKIYITYGEHDFTDNILHLVLARLPDAPEGVKGISLFVVPKFLEDGTKNDLQCTGVEHKLGIHASPTCSMSYGDDEGAVGYLLGEENRGLMAMFTMMNDARLSVGVQGVAQSEAAYQKALAYAKERKQGASVKTGEGPVPIIEHPGVRRALLEMKARTEAARALAYDAFHAIDLKNKGDKEAALRVELLTPIVKSWATDNATRVAKLGTEVHGGMGYIEETEAAVHVRDSGILPIYEGTNEIQSIDLIGRKVTQNGGAEAKKYIQEIQEYVGDNEPLQAALTDLFNATNEFVEQAKADPEYILAAAKPYLNAFGIVAGAAQMERRKQAAQRLLEGGEEDTEFLKNQIKTAEFYFGNILPDAHSELAKARVGSRSVVNYEF